MGRECTHLSLGKKGAHGNLAPFHIFLTSIAVPAYRTEFRSSLKMTVYFYSIPALFTKNHTLSCWLLCGFYEIIVGWFLFPSGNIHRTSQHYGNSQFRWYFPVSTNWISTGSETLVCCIFVSKGLCSNQILIILSVACNFGRSTGERPST